MRGFPVRSEKIIILLWSTQNRAGPWKRACSLCKHSSDQKCDPNWEADLKEIRREWCWVCKDEWWNTNNIHGVWEARLGSNRGWKAPAAEEGKSGLAFIFEQQGLAQGFTVATEHVSSSYSHPEFTYILKKTHVE